VWKPDRLAERDQFQRLLPRGVEAADSRVDQFPQTGSHRGSAVQPPQPAWTTVSPLALNDSATSVASRLLPTPASPAITAPGAEPPDNMPRIRRNSDARPANGQSVDTTGILRRRSPATQRVADTGM
jgi:hypothetical protein